MSKDQVSVKLSPELRQHLKAYKATQGKRSLEAAVVEILGSHFHVTQPPSQPSAIDSSIERIASLEAKVTYLSEQLEALKQAIASPATSTAPATTTPKSALESSASSTASQTPSETATSTDDLDDDMYDEPDEILYNFLEP
jgi:hypothetical protein